MSAQEDKARMSADLPSYKKGTSYPKNKGRKKPYLKKGKKRYKGEAVVNKRGERQDMKFPDRYSYGS